MPLLHFDYENTEEVKGKLAQSCDRGDECLMVLSTERQEKVKQTYRPLYGAVFPTGGYWPHKSEPDVKHDKSWKEME